MPHADVTSEKSFSKSGPAFESESAYTHSDDESGKSPSQDYSDNHFSKSPEADAESHRYDCRFKLFVYDFLYLSIILVCVPSVIVMVLILSFMDRGFDEPSFGSFDNNDDVDSIWGFNPVNTKVSLSKVFGTTFWGFCGSGGHAPPPIYLLIFFF